jgi:hypothetical protein
MVEKRITETRLKLRDAGIQMKLAIEHAREEDTFRSCVNSYISAARSITMVMERESAANPALLAWYKERTKQFAADPLFRFFNDQRVVTIHRGVVRPESQTFVVDNYQETRITDAAGKTTKQIQASIKAEEMPLRPGDVINGVEPNLAIYWTFPAAAGYFPNGSTNVFRLCEDYFVGLKDLVFAWLTKRIELGVDPPA